MSISEELIESPVTGVEVFDRTDEAALLSRAAWLLCLGLPIGVRARLGKEGADRPIGALPSDAGILVDDVEDWRGLGIPELHGSPPTGGRAQIRKSFDIDRSRHSTA